MKTRLPLILLAAVIYALTASASERQELSLLHGKMTANLPERDLIFSYRDSDGFMWYGTRNNLYRDDGYRIISFRPSSGNIFINAVAEGPGDTLWLATGEGAYIFDKKTGKFRVLDPERFRGGLVEQVFFSSDDMAWFAQQGVMRRYDSSGNWQADYPTIDRRGNPTRMSGFCETRQGDIWISTYSRGLLRYNRNNDRFVMEAPIPVDVSFGKIIQDAGRDYMWVADHDGNIYRFDPSLAGKPEAYVASVASSVDGIPGKDRIIDFIQDDTFGYLWVQTRNSLLTFAPGPDGSLKPVDINGKNGFLGAMITTICKIKGGIWVTCYDSPDYIIELGDQTMSQMEVRGTRERYGNAPILTAVCHDNDSGLIWFLQNRSGLVLLNPSTGQIADHDNEANMLSLRLYRANDIASSPSYGGVWVSRTRENTIYAVTNTGMLMHAVDSITLPDITPAETNITSMYEDNHGHLWVGASSGLYSFDIKRHTLSGRYPSIIKAVAIRECRDGSVWVATANNGLYRLEKSYGKEPELIGEPHHYTSMTVKDDNEVWLATAKGTLLSYDLKSGEWTDHSDILELNGAPLLQLHSDTLGHIWIVSNQKVVEYNPRNKAHRVYPASIGEGRGAFLSTTPSVDSTGNLAVGGLGGIFLFKPGNALDKEKSDIKTHVTDIKVEGVSVFFNDSLRYRPDENIVTLEPGDRNIEIEFSALDSRFAGDVRFAYRLKGHDKEWRVTRRGENVAVYNNLPKGNYLLEVKGCDENGLWSDHVASIKIVQKPYFYNTWWAWLIYALLASGALTALIHYLLRKEKQRNEEIWTDSKEMIKMRKYLSSPVSLPEEEFRELDKALLEKATKVVEANLSDPEFDVNSLAAGVNMSRSSLARKLKAITDRTPLEFICYIKMQHACRLLENQNHTVAEVAERVGFEDRRYFTASFKKDIGVTPSAYLRGERPGANNINLETKGDDNDKNEG